MPRIPDRLALFLLRGFTALVLRVYHHKDSTSIDNARRLDLHERPMDHDTCFPAMSQDERIVDKFRHRPSCGTSEFIAIVTNHRLLTRSKQTGRCCRQHSSYSSISLESIHRIDEQRVYRNVSIYLILWTVFLLTGIGGVLASIFLAEDRRMRILGIALSAVPLFLTTLVVFGCMICSSKRKLIELRGTFGSSKMIFAKPQGRAFAAVLSERIAQAKAHLSTIQTSTVTLPGIYPFDQVKRKDEQLIVSDSF